MFLYIAELKYYAKIKNKLYALVNKKLFP